VTISEAHTHDRNATKKPSHEKKNVRPYLLNGLRTGTDLAFLLMGLISGALQRWWGLNPKPMLTGVAVWLYDRIYGMLRSFLDRKASIIVSPLFQSLDVVDDIDSFDSFFPDTQRCWVVVDDSGDEDGRIPTQVNVLPLYPTRPWQLPPTTLSAH